MPPVQESAYPNSDQQSHYLRWVLVGGFIAVATIVAVVLSAYFSNSVSGEREMEQVIQALEYEANRVPSDTGQNPYGSLYVETTGTGGSEIFMESDAVNDNVWIAPIAREVLARLDKSDTARFDPSNGSFMIMTSEGLLQRGPFNSNEIWYVVATGDLDHKGVHLWYTYPDGTQETITVLHPNESSVEVYVERL